MTTDAGWIVFIRNSFRGDVFDPVEPPSVFTKVPFDDASSGSVKTKIKVVINRQLHMSSHYESHQKAT